MTVALLLANLIFTYSDPGAIERKIAPVLPAADEERWLEIPWRTSLMAARAEAQRDNKPIFAWVMNGHPLGLT